MELSRKTARPGALPTVSAGALVARPAALLVSRMTLRGSDPTAVAVAEGIEHLKSDLVAGFTPPDPMLQPNYWN